MEFITGQAQTKIEKVSFLGLSISLFTRNELIKFIEDTVQNKNKYILYGHAIWTFPMMMKHPEIFQYGEKADIFVTDGHIFYLLARFHGIPIKYEISIPGLVLLSLELANKNNWNIYLLGADDASNLEAQHRIRKSYPNIGSIGGHNGFFKDNDKKKITSEINNGNYNLLLIGISSPMKEILATEFKNETDTNLIIPCGGMIDVLAGKTKLTPRVVKKLGLASFYRVLQEPKRLFRRYLYIYGFAMFRLLPIYFYKVIICRNKSFSLPEYYKINYVESTHYNPK